MTDQASSEHQDRIGPVELLIIEFPRGEIRSEGFAKLTDLVDRGVIAVLDLEFVRRTADGSMHRVDLADAVEGADDDLSSFIGASARLLDADDIAAVGESIEPGSLAGVLLYEHVWIIPMVDAIEAGGARVLAAARVDPDDLTAAFDRLDDAAQAPSTPDNTKD
jgi:hypothetical protein